MFPLTRGQLDAMGCGHPNHPPDRPCPEGGLYFHARCHPGEPPWVRYEDGLLHIECSVCKGEVCDIAVV